MYQKLYSRFLAAHSEELHFASHSHHYWPDVTRDAHLHYWDDSCRYVDNKWEYLFSQKIPHTQNLIAEILKLSSPTQLVFAPNTHEFVFRLLTSLDWNKPVRILTTDSEFYSFDRQINRLNEFSQFEVVKVPTLPFHDFHERFESEMKKGHWDLIFMSHVFFNSGLVADIQRLVKNAPASATFVIDGYHGFMAVPTDLSSIEERAFYLAGSYKYAQGGEGCCFLYVPTSVRHRPFYTGWFAELSHLSSVGNKVPYPPDALQYAGSTMDFSALYRLTAVLDLFKKENITVDKIHAWIQQNQKTFMMELKKKNNALLNDRTLICEDLSNHGHFLTFEMPSVEITQNMVKDFKSRGLLVDSRGTRLRFGFGLYHNTDSVTKAVRLI